MAGVSIKINGMDKAIRKFKRFPKDLNKALSRSIKLSALLIEREVKPLTPVDTGRLRSSIQTIIRPLFATIAPHTEYAIFVHEGTYRMGARPFLVQGAKKAEPRIQKIFNLAIEKVLRKK